MKKRFCTTGTCIPEKNYMVDISGRIDRIISEYIENGQYFTGILKAYTSALYSL